MIGKALFATLGNFLSYDDTGTDHGHVCYYKVSARNTNGEGPKSNETSATSMGLPGTPRGDA